MKQIISLILAVAILMVDVLNTVAYAQDMSSVVEENTKFTTLVTDTVAAPQTVLNGQGVSINSLVPEFSDVRSSYSEAGFIDTAKVRKLAKTDYRPNEDIEVVIENGVHKGYKTELIDAIGNTVAIETDEVDTGATKVITLEQPSSFRPGKYTLRISDTRGGVSEQDFSWGVLAVNPDKSVYHPNETANFAFGVLDEGGNMVCDAQVELKIKKPDGKEDSLSTDNGKIKVNPECASHDFTLNPDYDAHYTVGGVGVYALTLKSQTKNGTFTITDSFEVRQSIPFDVKRVTATRIYPPNQYPVTMEITANQDFEGTITETVPASFRIAKPGEKVMSEADHVDEMVAKQVAEEAAASGSAQKTELVKPTPAIQAPDNLPKNFIPGESVMAYSTINDLQQNSGVKAVLGASVPGLGMPFAGNFPVSQEFGESLVHDVHDHDLYESFGMNGHDGIDFGVPVGTPLLSVDNGKVLLAGDGDYGTTIVIQHAWGRSYYGHLSAVSVKDGDEVQRGQTIGNSGNTGISTGPHLHFGLKPDSNDGENGYYGKVDPAYYLGMKQSASSVLGVATSAETDPNSPAAQNFPSTPETDVKILTWKVKVKKGDKIKIGYNYLAPRISPQFYTLGPATFTDATGKEIFHETRKWQIAADALEYKFKRGSFAKSTCTATCSQSITGVGFRPKAIILEWVQQTTEGNAITHANVGMGFGTNNGGSIQERSVTYGAEDNIGTADTYSYRSATKVIVFTDGTTGSAVAAADLVSFDTDGFTLSWTTNNASAYLVNFTALGGADVSNAKAGTFTMTNSAGSQSSTDPGFRPDFVTFISAFTGAADTGAVAEAHFNLGFAKSSADEAAFALYSDDADTVGDTYRQQRTDASILLIDNGGAGAQDAVADFTSMDATGFTVNKSDAPAASTEIYYLALQGGQYDVGSFNKNTTTGEQEVSGLGFRPSGVFLATDGNTTSSSIVAEGILSLGGGSVTTNSTEYGEWCNDASGITCNTSWTNRRPITFNNAASSENLTDFPVMVKLSSSAGNIDFNKTKAGGDDIRFVDPSDPTNVLAHEVESWNEPGGEAVVWVKVPQIDAGSSSDFIWMYYNNSSATNGQQATSVWDSSFTMVHHMEEPDPGTVACTGTVELCDSTSSDFDMDDTQVDDTDNASGQVNGAINLDGSAEYFSRAASPIGAAPTGNITFSAWLYRSAAIPNGSEPLQVTEGIDGDAGTSYMEFYVDSTLTIDFGTRQTGFGSQTAATANTTSPLNTWQYVAGTINSSGVQRIFINGTDDSSSTPNMVSVSGFDTTAIGAALDSGGDSSVAAEEFWPGMIDEVRISTTQRSADWIEAEYLTMTDALSTYGSEQDSSNIGTIITTQDTQEGGIAVWDDDGPTITEIGTATFTSKALRILNDPAAGSVTTLAEADLQAFNPDSFTLNWTTADATAQEIIYWAAGSVTASQEDYRWYKNTNAVTPTTALEDENQSTIVPKTKANARLRANMSVGGNGLNASSQGYKLQYYSGGAETGQAATSDWCNDTTGVTCIAPGPEVTTTTTPSDWCNDSSGVSCTASWSARKKITINATNLGTLTDFPILVKLDSNDIDRTKTQNDGDDLRFTDSAGTVLNHEVENYDETGDDFVWVSVDITGGSSTGFIWMYYGNASVPSPRNQTGDDTHSEGVWDSNFEAVYHLRETGTAAAGEYKDSTNNNNDAQGGNGVAGSTPDPTTGQFGTGQLYNGTSDYIELEQTSGLWQNYSALSVSIWASTTDNSGRTLIGGPTTVAAGIPATSSEFWLNASSELEYWEGSPRSTTHSSTTATTVTNGVTYHYGLAVDTVDNSLKQYKDGTRITNLTTYTDANISAKEWIGGNDGTDFWPGTIDEVRFSLSDRTEDWMEAEYATGTDSINSFGTEEANSSSTTTTGGWSVRKKITFDNSAASAALTDFPVLVKLDSSRIDYNKVQDNGEDLRFVDPSDNTTVLSHEIESWNEDGYSYVWVKVPSLAASNTDYIWMYYNNPEADDGQNPTGVWDSNYRMVYHMDDASGAAMNDSTSNNKDGAQGTGGSQPVPTTTGKVNGNFNFDGSADSLSVASPSMPTGDFTFATWVNLDANTDENLINTLQGDASGTPNNNSIDWFIDSSNLMVLSLNSNGATDYDSVSTIPTGQWTYLVVTRSGSTITGYINGVVDGPTATYGNALLIGSQCSLNVGFDADSSTSNCTATPGNWIDGDMDELRISIDDRSASWIQAEYLTMTDAMNSFSEELPYTTGGTTISGWTDVADVWCSDSTGITCDTGWSYRKRVTIDNGSSSTNLSNFPVLVKLDASRIDYSKTQDDGDDLRFVDPSDPTTVLSHEIEGTWDEAGTNYVWVEVPQLAAGSTTDSIWMYYGNSTVSSGQDASNVWDNYHIVYHMDESAGNVSDSAGTAQDASRTGSTVAQATGKVGYAQDFSSTGHLQTANSPGLPTGDFTYEVWVQFDAVDDENIFGTADGSTGDEARLYAYASGFEADIESTVTIFDPVQPSTSTWYHIAYKRTTSTINFYKNGAEDDTTQTDADALNFGTCPLLIGADTDTDCTLGPAKANYLDGRVDEFRISNTSRSADWIEATYLTQTDQMNTYGDEETQTSSKWKFKHNSSVSDGATITSAVLSTSTAGNQMTYQESNITGTNPTAIAVGEKREFDFSLDGSNASNRRTYYFRIVTAEGTPLTNYTRYPSITVGIPNQKVMRGGKYFNYKASQPFTF